MSRHAHPLNKWMHVAVSRKGDVLCIYMDGKKLQCQSGWGNIDIQNARSGTGIGTAWLRARVLSRSMSPQWGSIRFRPPICTYRRQVRCTPVGRTCR